MATKYLLNSVRVDFGKGTVGPTFLTAGEKIDDTQVDVSKIVAAGGQVSASSNATVVAAATIAQKLKKQGAPVGTIDAVMLAAAVKQLGLA